MNVTVETADLRAALRSVLPHVHPDKDYAQLHRVRLEVGPENVTVSATNRYTVGHALVSLWDNTDGELASVDLSPIDVKEILTLFHARKAGHDEPDDTLRIEADDEHLTVTDISGLFPGKALTLPRQPTEDNFPKVEEIIRTTLVRGKASTDRMITAGQMLGLFIQAAAAYGAQLVIDPAGNHGALLITCGESFIGLLMPQRPDDVQLAVINGWHRDWMTRIDAKAVLV
jgi:hypothetical protein